MTFIAAVIFTAGFSNAEDNDNRENLQLGFKVGANISNVYDTKGQDFSANPTFGFAGGAFLGIPIGKYLGVQPEILFSQRGFEAEGRVLLSDYKFVRTSSFIDVPLLIQFKPTANFTLLAGPQYSYLINQKDVFTSTYINTTQQQDFNNSNLRKNIFCFTGGFDINYKHFVFGARAGWDLTNNNGDGTSTNPRYKNVWYQATIGYSIF